MPVEFHQAEVLIIGGGLSGLHTVYELHKRGVDFLLVEARDRLGGRILSRNVGNTVYDDLQYDSARAAFDLGPSWFWPGQSRMLNLIDEIGLSDKVFMQAGIGEAIFEDNQGNIQRGVSGISMSGAYRMNAGIREIVTTLEQTIPSELLIKQSAVTHIEYKQEEIVSAVMVDGVLQEYTSNYVILALPPRVALSSIKFTPHFTQKRLDELYAVATWMAGHAKLVCVYSDRFWNEVGFSGDVISHRGPLQEIHDASSENGELSALFGFVGVRAEYRKGRENDLCSKAIAQLTGLFGEAAAKPIETHIKDWAYDAHTSTSYDQQMLTYHPVNDIGKFREKSWNGKLIWSGSESADFRQHNNGFLEGALEASLRATSIFDG